MTRPWADQPFKITSTPTETETQGISAATIKVATEMTLAHSMITRNLNAIYLQAPGVVSPSDIKDFLLFSQIVIDEIHLHHWLEETYFFPDIAKYTGEKDIMSVNVEQHHAFDKGMKSFDEYIKNTTPAEYDGKKMQQLLDEFGPVLTQHLTDEIQTLLALDKYGGDRLLKVWIELDKRVVSLMDDKHKALPVGLGARDVTFEGGKWADWPPIPWFIFYLTKYYFARKHKECWKFSPCTIMGQPRPLEFVNDVK